MNRDDPKKRPKAEDLLQFIDKMQVYYLYCNKLNDFF